mmetsp:Transcript_52734/g.125560  ORF Transcript_52734/g.125560 Transcript_52734/m.125560 type:complete len:299 (-) Transcript_52734:59-955(-)
MVKTELHRLVLDDDDEVLLEHLSVPFNRANIDAKDCVGWTPLHWACSKNMVVSARILLEHGANACSATDDGWTPAHDAARLGSKDLLDLLQKHGAKLSAATTTGTTPLHYCVQYGHGKAVNWMTHMWEEGRKEINRPNVQGWTPLHFSARYGRPELAKQLLESGASAFHKDKQGRHPRGTAENAMARIKAGTLKITKSPHSDTASIEDYEKVAQMIQQAEKEQLNKCRMVAMSAVVNAEISIEGQDLVEAIGSLQIAIENYKLVDMHEQVMEIEQHIQKLEAQLAASDATVLSVDCAG